MKAQTGRMATQCARPGRRGRKAPPAAARAGLLVAAAFALLALPALAAAFPLPPAYPAQWTPLPVGLRLIPSSQDTRALCPGPSGSVYHVALGNSGGGYRAIISRVRVSDGTVLKTWTYPTTASAIPRAAGRDSAGNLFVAMDTQVSPWDWLVVKFSPNGGKLWSRHYDSGKGQDTPYGLVVDHHDNVIVAGTSAATGSYDSAVVKWKSGGGLAWKKVIGTSGMDLIGTVAVDAADNVYVCGQLGLAPGTGKAMVRSYTSGGSLRWQATASNLAGPLSFHYMVVTGSAVYVAGELQGADPQPIVMKYKLSGLKSWSGARYLVYTHGAWPNGFAADGSGAPVMVTTVYQAGTSGEDLPGVWKLTSAGASAWLRTFPSWPFDGQFDAVAIDGSGNVYAAGGVMVSAGTGNLIILRYTSAGGTDAIWRSDGPGSGYCDFSDILITGGKVLAAGQVQGGSGSQAAVYRAKLTP